MDELEGPAMWDVARKMAGAVRKALHASGANLLLADGELAGQEVDHLHLHVIPRSRSDDLVFTARSWTEPAPTREELIATASLLAPALR